MFRIPSVRVWQLANVWPQISVRTRVTVRSLAMVVAIVLATTGTGRAESVTECQELFRTGQYAKCRDATGAAIESRSYGEEWPILKARSELAVGEYDEALATVAAGIERYSWSVRLRMLEHDAALALGRKEQAAAALTEIERQVSGASWRYTDADDLVALGHAALALGADPRDVQEGFFERARRNYKTRPDGFLAAGQLANRKHDFQLAAEILIPAAKQFETDGELQFALSQALRTADKEQSSALLQKTLEINPHYEPALQRIAENQIDAENYADAEVTLTSMLQVNPHSPTAHALQAVIHHLRNDAEAEQVSRDAATEFSGPNANVYFLIGERLSRKYRFAEGAAYQRMALDADPAFHDAAGQLAQDLLRLGDEEAGWAQAEAAHKADGYSTTLYNLLQLKTSMERFTTLKSDHFELRMQKEEAGVYGQRALALLEQAHLQLTDRYHSTPEGPIVVEIFPRPEDFAVRTFGIPDVAGFLGVCFGRVITANSPASRRDNPSSWESVLWHEFCHVVTLQMTHNRIPRWLSEGISVYEERRFDPRWGQSMTAEFHDRIIAEKITPVSRLSSAFLDAKSGEDLNFAYYESSMVVAYIVEQHGMDALIAVLNDLAAGVTINDALDRHCGGIDELDTAFHEFLTQRAVEFAGDAEFDTTELAALLKESPDALTPFFEEHPNNVPAGLATAIRMIQAGKLDDAEALLVRLVQLAPHDASVNGPRVLLADLYQKLGRAEDEVRLRQDHVARNADDLATLTRLQELSIADGQHAATIVLAESIRAVDPFQTVPIQKMAEAAEQINDVRAATSALNSLLQLQPDDAARSHYRLATLLKSTDPVQAHRHALLALEQAPRYRAAHRLLLELQTTIAEPAPAPAEESPEPNVESQ